MPEEFVDLPHVTFRQATELLGLYEDKELPLLRKGGDIVLFRGQSETQKNLTSALYGGADYGDGAYLGNTPSSVAGFAYPDKVVGVYRLPEIDETTVRLAPRRLVNKGSDQHPIEVFPARWSRLTRRMSFSGEQQDRHIPEHWVLIREPSIYRNAKMIARLGLRSIGVPRK